MTSNTNFAEIIFGSKNEARRLYVEELREERIKKGLSPEQLDEFLVDRNVPRCREVEENHALFTKDFHQALAYLCLDHEAVPAITGKKLMPQIMVYLKNPDAQKKVLNEFHSKCKSVHVTIYPQDMDTFIEKVFTGEARFRGGPNSVSPEEYALMFVASAILDSV